MNTQGLTPTQRTLAALNRCAEACVDGQKGYGIAAADARDQTLKEVLRNYEMQRAEFVTTLESAVDRLAAYHENHGTLRGTMHRAWIEARRDIDVRTDETIIDECIRGETSALRTFDAILAEGLPEDVRTILAFERNAIGIALDDLRNRLAFPSALCRHARCSFR